jgi:peroxiredoxin
LAQLRQDYSEFVERGAEILILGPDGPNAFRRYWQENQMPFIGMADIKSVVAQQYDQEVNIFKMGRMPSIFVVDRSGVIRFSHYAKSMSDYPTNPELLDVLDQINLEEAQ